MEEGEKKGEGEERRGEEGGGEVRGREIVGGKERGWNWGEIGIARKHGVGGKP